MAKKRASRGKNPIVEGEKKIKAGEKRLILKLEKKSIKSDGYRY